LLLEPWPLAGEALLNSLQSAFGGTKEATADNQQTNTILSDIIAFPVFW
jgi:hypothetical protein